MSKQIVQGIAKNTGFMFIQQVITWASTFLLMIFLPRYLGPKEYGTVFLGTSIGAIFGIIVSYGGNYYVAKSVSRDPTRTAQIMVDASAFRIVLWIVAFLGSIVFCKIANYSWHEQTVIFIFVGALCFQGPSLVMYSCFQGHERMEFTSRGMIIEKVFVSAVGILALLGGAGAVTIAIVMIAGSFLNFLIMFKYSRVIAPSLPRVNWQSALSEMKAGIPYSCLWHSHRSIIV
jgi:O-antigen/teichoic acid export membrane protein